MFTKALSNIHVVYRLIGISVVIFCFAKAENITNDDDENSYTTAVKPLYRMTVNWLEVVQPSEKGSVLGEIRFKGRYILYVSYF